MSFKVEFEIYRGGRVVPNGILVYETTTEAQRKRSLSNDVLDSYGRANTFWHSDWSGESIEVYCHTDGQNRGRPAYVGRVVLRSGAFYKLTAR